MQSKSDCSLRQHDKHRQGFHKQVCTWWIIAVVDGNPSFMVVERAACFEGKDMQRHMVRSGSSQIIRSSRLSRFRPVAESSNELQEAVTWCPCLRRTWWLPARRLGIPGPATGIIWAFRAESCKWSLEMGSRALSAPGPQKSKTESKKSQNRLFFNYFDSFSTPSWTFWTPGPRGPGNPFRTLFATFGLKGPNDRCSGQKFSLHEEIQGLPPDIRVGYFPHLQHEWPLQEL